MSALPIVFLSGMMSSFLVAAVVAFLILTNRNTPSTGTGTGTGPSTETGAGTGTFPSTGGSGWKKANATYYWSYPRCCPDSPAYDKGADKSECDDYSGCRWMGMLSAFPDKKSFDWVKSNNIASFFEVGQTEESWKRKWKNKKLRIRNHKTGNAMDVVVVDRCGDNDCGGCCTKNAKKNGGTLIDLEWHTARRFWGSDSMDGEAPIEWKCLNC